MNNEPSYLENNGSNVLVLSGDLFFAMRIRDALKQQGYMAQIVKSEAAFQEAMDDSGQLALGIIDFNHGIDWDVLAQVLTGSDLPTIAFGPHKDTESFAAARRAGVTRVISNGAFTSSLPDLVQKYAWPIS